MCGINGFNFKNEDLIRRMMTFTQKRGPDASNFFSNENVTLGHDRLSIIDLKERSNQPFNYKHLTLSYNGEIYNYKSLKKVLENQGYVFKTTSDTEVIIFLFDKYGIESFKKLSGIFAISIWDDLNKTLYLIRDIVGVKPLYYYEDSKDNFLFSSSIRSILSYNSNYEINEKALFYYKNIGRNESNETFFKGIYKLLPGQLIIKKKNQSKKIFKYLNFRFNQTNFKDPKEKISEIIKSQFISDVPIALSLSGGYDSNIIYDVMRNNIEKKNYSIYSFFFHDYNKFNQDYNIAKLNCQNFNDKLNTVEISYKDYQNNIEKVIDILEEPISNQSSVLNYIMAQNVKEKVIMTGDGGDEIFGGYDHYKSAYFFLIFSKLNFLKKFIRLNTKFKNINRLFLEKSKEFFLSFNEGNLMKNKNIYFKNFLHMDTESIYLNHCNNFNFTNSLNDMLYLDIDTKIPNDYLRRNDSIFMNFSIEARVPFLDQNMIENFLFMDEKKKYNYSFENKGFLKKLFKNNFHHLKFKHGLQSPLAKWMKRELQPFIKEILSKNYYQNSNNMLNFSEIEKLIKRHKDQYFNPELIWSLVVLQIFMRKYKL